MVEYDNGENQDEEGGKVELEEQGGNEENCERIRRMKLLLKIKKRKILGRKARQAKENMTPKLQDKNIIIKDKENTNVKEEKNIEQIEKETEECKQNNEESERIKNKDKNEKEKKEENIITDEGKEMNHLIKGTNLQIKNKK